MSNWHRFWAEREGQLVDKKPFYQNFKVLHEKIRARYGTKDGLKSLEVGCGRGIMSDYLHAYGWDTHCVDNYYTALEENHDHKFYKADAFDLPFPDDYFDLVFSYGLLEHFKLQRQLQLLHHMESKTRKDCLNLHYVVPRKITNYLEDSNVYRDPCYFLRSQNVLWVYPAIGMHIYKGQAWETNKWMGKGFWYADISSGNS